MWGKVAALDHVCYMTSGSSTERQEHFDKMSVFASADGVPVVSLRSCNFWQLGMLIPPVQPLMQRAKLQVWRAKILGMTHQKMLNKMKHWVFGGAIWAPRRSQARMLTTRTGMCDICDHMHGLNPKSVHDYAFVWEYCCEIILLKTFRSLHILKGCHLCEIKHVDCCICEDSSGLSQSTSAYTHCLVPDRLTSLRSAPIS